MTDLLLMILVATSALNLAVLLNWYRRWEAQEVAIDFCVRCGQRVYGLCEHCYAREGDR